MHSLRSTSGARPAGYHLRDHGRTLELFDSQLAPSLVPQILFPANFWTFTLELVTGLVPIINCACERQKKH